MIRFSRSKNETQIKVFLKDSKGVKELQHTFFNKRPQKKHIYRIALDPYREIRVEVIDG